ncbi:ATP-dependent RNA helicase DDX4-like [Styela clava]
MFDDADDWDADPSSGFGGQTTTTTTTSSFGGFGSGDADSGGFQKSFGKGSSSQMNGFGGDSGGGFASSRSRACFKCGEDGHMSRDCPNSDSGGGSRSKGCFKCGEEGHMSRECPNGDSGSGFGGGTRACYKCGEEGHMSRECPKNDSGGGSFGGGSRSCYKCGEAGHMSRDCPQNTGGGSGGGSRSCYKCGEEGHISRDCPNGDSGTGGGGSRGKGCFKCGEDGHMARECPNADSSGGDRPKGCFKCGEEGHMSRECPKNEGGGDRPPLYIPPPPPEDEEAIFASMQTGINFNKYDDIPVEVSGDNPPAYITSFDDAGLPETVRSNVEKAKYAKPTPVQKYSIPIINSDRDLMACAQTGSGKTAAFLLPVLAGMFRNGLNTVDSFSDKQLPQAIVVGPTRELVVQIFLEARKFARSSIIKPVVAYGGTSVGSQLRDLSRGCNILIATPGRLLDFINRGKVGCSGLQYLILDEADRMLDMGFEPEIRRLAAAPGMPDKNNRHTLMFSATFPDEIQKLAHDFLRDDFLFLTVGRVGGACSDVTQTILQVDGNDKRDTLVEKISDVAETRARTLVFVDTKRNADFLASYLSQEGFPTTSIHGDRLQREREMALRDFKSGQCPIMIATSVAARGLDIPKVEHVINYDLPSEIDEYVHRIGRTGRCGNLGMATSFYCHDKDNTLARSMVKVLADAQQEVPDWLEACAEGAVGTSFGPKGGQFGARDTRSMGGGRGGNSSRAKGDFDYNDGGGTSTANTNSGGGFDDDNWG